MEQTQNVENLSRSKKMRKEIESPKAKLPLKKIKKTKWGDKYEVNLELRRNFPNSYFLDECLDEAICGIDLITGSITYAWEDLGYLYQKFNELSSGDLFDRMQCSAIVINWTEKLTQEELQGKIKPTFIFPTWKMDMKIWEWMQVLKDCPIPQPVKN